MTFILAIDLGKFKSVACEYHTDTTESTFQTLKTRPQILHDLIVSRSPDRVVIENGNQAGWVKEKSSFRSPTPTTRAGGGNASNARPIATTR
jgi:hypothetical protein